MNTEGSFLVVSDLGEAWYDKLNPTVMHRVDGPALVYPEGAEEWRQDGILHRVDGPALVYPDGAEEWRKNGVKHRIDGPAAVRYDGREEWWLEGLRHRLGGPAVIRPGRSNEWSGLHEEWWVEGQLHRVDGPAEVWEITPERNGWWLFGKSVERVEMEKFWGLLVKEFGENDASLVPYKVLKELFLSK